MGLATNDNCCGVIINKTEVTCPKVIACITAQPTGAPAVAGDLVLGADAQFHALPAAMTGSQAAQAARAIATAPSTWTTAASIVAPRTGRVIVTGGVYIQSTINGSLAGAIGVNGVLKRFSNMDGVGGVNSPSAFGGGAPQQGHASMNAAVAWTGDVVAGDVLSIEGITVIAAGQMQLGNIEYTYII